MGGQGSLEYLVIIAVILAISSIVVLYASGVIGTQKSAVSVSFCKQTAEKCELSKMTSPDDPCNACIDACANATANPCSQPEAAQGVSHGAIGCCKKGKSDQIYLGSWGCGTPVHLDGPLVFYAPSDWESTKASTFCLTYPLYKVSHYDGAWHSFICSIATPSYTATYDFYVCPEKYISMVSSAPIDVTA
jgi:hypothetical protein